MIKIRIYIILLLISGIICGATTDHLYTFVKVNSYFYAILCILILATNTVFIFMNYNNLKNSIVKVK